MIQSKPHPMLTRLMLIVVSMGLSGMVSFFTESVTIATESVSAAASLPLDRIHLPPGFKIETFMENVPNARSMALSSSGTLFVGSMSAGKVYAIPDRNHDGRGDEVITLASGLHMPNGVALKDGALYVAEVGRILRFDNIEADLKKSPTPVVVTSALPTETHHGWKFIAFGPDGKLYIPVGAPCNICLPDAKHANILRMNPDGTGMEVFASGIRNTVGFTWHPLTREMWFTDNGRDMLGDDSPPDELNLAPKAGMNFGFPYCHAGQIVDPEFGDAAHPCSAFTPPVKKLGPHVAALGLRFYTGNQFPIDYKNDLIIAEHGSWNRSTPIGYRLMRVKPSASPKPTYEVFAEGWLGKDGKAWGRPVDVQVASDGSLLVSDDLAGAIYRISYAAVSNPTPLKQ